MVSAKWWLCLAQKILLVLGVLGGLSATSASALELISVNKEGTDSGNGWSGDPCRFCGPVISADGQFVAFHSHAGDLVAIPDGNGSEDVFVRDRQNGITTLVSINHMETSSGESFSYYPVISADGRFVAFSSPATNMMPGDTKINHETFGDIFVRDLRSGTTTLVSTNKDGTDSGSHYSVNPVISADGRFVAFSSYGRELVALDDVRGLNVYVRDLVNETTTLASVNHDGTSSGAGYSVHPAISADGRFVVFESDADNLVARDTNSRPDVFVWDHQNGINTLVSVNKDGTDSGNKWSRAPAISKNNRFVAFESYADDLVSTDTNGTSDVFIRDLRSGTTTLVSVNKDGNDSGNAISVDPVISADGRFVAFISNSDDLVSTDTKWYIGRIHSRPSEWRHRFDQCEQRRNRLREQLVPGTRHQHRWSFRGLRKRCRRSGGHG
jgi:Tol biopolymer transport system component